MKKNLIALSLCLVMLITLAACGSSTGSKSPAGSTPADNSVSSGDASAPDGVIKLTMGGTNSENNALTLADRYFIEQVQEKSGGRIQIDYYPNSTLGGDRAMVDAILAGTIDISQCSASNFSQYSTALDFLELPGIFANLDHYYAVLESDEIMQPAIDTIERETGLTILRATTMGGEARALLYSGDEIRVPADCKGRLMRTTGSTVEIALFDALGISSQVVEYNETYTALQQNMVNGLYLQPNAAVEGLFPEVVDNCTYVNESYVTHLLVASTGLKDKLGEELYEILCSCIDDSVEYAKEQWANVVADAHAELAKSLNCIELTDEEQAQWDEVCGKVRDKFIGTSVTQEQIDAINDLK